MPLDATHALPPETLGAGIHTYPIYRPAVNYKVAHINNPPPNTNTCTVKHFGLKLRLTPPLAAESALLMYFTYHESYGIQPFPAMPVTRAIRDATQLIQPSVEDLEAHNRNANTRFVPSAPKNGLSDESKRFDEDFQRLLWCGNPFDLPYTANVYKLGSLTGLWEGRIVVCLPLLRALIGINRSWADWINTVPRYG